MSSSVTLIGDQALVDATAAEEEVRSGSLVLSVMPSIDQVSYCLFQGTVEASDAISAFEKCLDNAHVVYSAMKQCLIDGVDGDDCAVMDTE